MQELRRMREGRGWTQQRLADESGVDRATISQIESGRRSPSIETLEKLANAMGEEMGDFFPKAQASLFQELPNTERSTGQGRAFGGDEEHDIVDAVSRDTLKQMLKRYERVKQQLAESGDGDRKRQIEALVDRFIRGTIQVLREKQDRTERAKSHSSERQDPYPWMSETLARLIDGWEQSIGEEEVDGRYAHAVAIAAIDALGAVHLMGEPGETLRDRVPERELNERSSVAERLLELSQHAIERYRASDVFEPDQEKQVVERRNEIRLAS